MKINLKNLALVFVLSVFALLAFGCASTAARQALLEKIDYKEIPFDQLESAIASVKEDGHGFIVKAYVSGNYNSNVKVTHGFNEQIDATVRISGKAFASEDDLGGILMRKDTTEFYTGILLLSPENERAIRSRVSDFYQHLELEGDWLYTVYVAALKEDLNGKKSSQYNGVVTKIEGLRTTNEIYAARSAEAEAKREAKLKGKVFVGPPPDSTWFDPDHYKKADLFDAVAAAKKLDFDSSNWLRGSEIFVSDVVFVSQNGTDITFKTADNAISQMMTVDSRTDLKPGQKVRVYYVAYRIKEWHVNAIERL